MRQKLQNSKGYTESPEFLPTLGLFITPHAQHERGKVIGVGVHVRIYIIIYICLWTKPFFLLYFSDRFTFSNIRGRTSRRFIE